MHLCSAAYGYSHWKFKSIGFVLNGIDYHAVLVRWETLNYIFPSSPQFQCLAGSSKDSESNEECLLSEP